MLGSYGNHWAMLCVEFCVAEFDPRKAKFDFKYVPRHIDRSSNTVDQTILLSFIVRIFFSWILFQAEHVQTRLRGFEGILFRIVRLHWRFLGITVFVWCIIVCQKFFLTGERRVKSYYGRHIVRNNYPEKCVNVEQRIIISATEGFCVVPCHRASFIRRKSLFLSVQFSSSSNPSLCRESLK